MFRSNQHSKLYRRCFSYPCRRGRLGSQAWYPRALTRYDQHRAFSIPPVLLPPIIFLGLGVSLWTWKCFMMIVFQNKIIYMPGLPPNARRERIQDYQSQCGGIVWREERIRAADRTRISLCVASVKTGPIKSHGMKRVYIVYFQGNASSLPPRLPFLSPVLRSLKDHPLDESNPFQYTIVCCSYRGYWTSSGRPSETGIAQDAAASLEWVKNQEANELQEDGPQTQPTPVILWGQSIGCGVATSLAARQELFSEGIELRTLILETPFLSIRSMLETIYPQKWLPYQYLWPFLRNHFDSVQALTNVEENSRRFGHKAPNVLILEAGKDELVPAVHGKILGSHCLELGLKFRKVVVPSAYHTEVMTRGPEGRVAVVESVLKAVKAKSL